MAKKLTIRPKPTKREYEILNQYLTFRDWHFNGIKAMCTELYSFQVHWDDTWPYNQYALVYGLRATRGQLKEPCIASFFIKYSDKVYQSYHWEDIAEILKLFRKAYLYNDYTNSLERLKYKKKRELLRRKKAKNKL